MPGNILQQYAERAYRLGHRGEMRRQQVLRVLPEGMVRRGRLSLQDVEHYRGPHRSLGLLLVVVQHVAVRAKYGKTGVLAQASGEARSIQDSSIVMSART